MLPPNQYYISRKITTLISITIDQLYLFLWLSRLHTQHGAWTHNSEIQSCMLHHWLSQPCTLRSTCFWTSCEWNHFFCSTLGMEDSSHVVCSNLFFFIDIYSKYCKFKISLAMQWYNPLLIVLFLLLDLCWLFLWLYFCIWRPFSILKNPIEIFVWNYIQ